MLVRTMSLGIPTTATRLALAATLASAFACAAAPTPSRTPLAPPFEPETRAAAETLAALARTPDSNVTEGEGGVVLSAYTIEWQQRVEWWPIGAGHPYDVRGPHIVREPVRVGPFPWLLRLDEVEAVEAVAYLLGGARVEITLSKPPWILHVVQPDEPAAKTLAWAIDVLRRAKQIKGMQPEAPPAVESPPRMQRAPVLEPPLPSLP